MPELQSYSELLQSLFDKVDIYTTVRSFNDSVRDVPRPLLLLHAANLCLSEVHNGGFLQFFFNSAGILCPEAIEGFKALNMQGLAETAAAAATPLGTPYPRDREDRLDALLEASQRGEQQVKEIFETTTDFYLAIARATEPLGFDALNSRAWHLALEENGGFQINAMRYAQEFADRQDHPTEPN